MGVFFLEQRRFRAALLSGWPLIAILILWAGVAMRSVAQDEQPLIVPHRTLPLANKKVKANEPRAVGVVQLNGSKGTLVPIAILINGRFFDASAYKADPVPMAIESGTVYELERAGDSEGVFTVNSALHSKSVGNVHPWVATGSFLPPGKEAAKNTHKAEDVPVGLNETGGDAPPRLTRKEAAKGSAPDSGGSSSGTPGAEKSGGTASAPSNSGSAGQETSKAPTASGGEKGGGDSGKQQASAPAPAGGSSSGQASSGKVASPQSSGGASGGASDDNYYRPKLRRGKPTEAAPPDEQDAVVARKIAETGTADPIAGTGAAAVKWVAAISDAAGPDPASYKFFWKTGEEDERRNQMIALAQNEVRVYAAALVKNQISGSGAAPKSAALKAKTAVKQPEPTLESVEFRGFDVWLTNQPVLVLTAEAKSPAAGNSVMPESYSVTVVARTDIYGNLQKLYSAVTDRFHLDVTPRLSLIDVVDADGDGRGELLFQETTDAGNGYLIYRATADRLWKMFDSLSAK